MKNNLLTKIMLFSFCVLFIASFAFSNDTGGLRIFVYDDEGTALPGVEITVSSPNMMGTKSMISDDKGEVVFYRLFPAVYEIKANIEGFQEVITKDVRIRLDKETAVRVEMKASPIQESIIVVAETPPVDTKNITVAEHITHDFVEALPVARDYLGYIQLALGVDVVPNSGGRDTPDDPAGKGGTNYDPKRGIIRSRDNVYYMEGVNITDLSTQWAGTKFNNEVIQEQQVITSGVPAEYGGGKGVVSNIITRSGGNRFSGSLNFYLQRKSFWADYGGLAAEDGRLQAYIDNKYDTAATLGGPIIKDNLWFFLSGQYRKNADTFNLSSNASPTEEEVDYTEKRTNTFGKISLRLSGKDTLSFIYFLDKYDILGSRSKNYVKSRQFVRDRDYTAYMMYYQRIFSENLIIDFRYAHYHMIELTEPRYPETGPFTDIIYPRGMRVPRYELQKGSYMSGQDDKNVRDVFTLRGEWFEGNMRFKAGLEYQNDRDKDDRYIWGDEQLYSLANMLKGVTFGQLLDMGLFSPNSFRYQILPILNSNWSATSEFFDFNNDHYVSEGELRQAVFDAEGEHGINFWRWNLAKRGINNVKALRWIGYIVNDWEISKYFTLNAGLRFENHNYRDSKAGEILHMKTVIMPRIGIAWDIGGRGNQKLTLFYGQYSDPMDFEIIHRVGDLSGRLLERQIWLANDWLTYAYHGSADQRTSYFSKSLEDPIARELALSYFVYLGDGFLIQSQVYYRKDVNIVEDYDINLYTQNIVGDPVWGDLALPLDHFGYTAANVPTDTRWFVANLLGAKRSFAGFDIEASKRFTGGSSIVAQYSFKEARGNSISDKNFRSQGNSPELDPRNDWMYGALPGTVPHKIKLFGNYRTPFGLNIGFSFFWNSGMVFTESRGRDTPWPLNDEWTEFATAGEERAIAWSQANLKFSYRLRFAARASFELFMDIYNITNNQEGINIEWTHMSNTWDYKQTNRVLNPRRIFLGARFRF